MGDFLLVIFVVITSPIWISIGLWIVLYLISTFIGGHVLLFMMALEAGFLGLMAYIVGWVFLAPAMLIVALILGTMMPWII